MNRKSEKFNKNFFTNWLNKIKEIIDKMEKEMKEYINQLQQNIKNSEEYFDDLVKQINNESLLLDYAFAYKNKVIFNKEKLFQYLKEEFFKYYNNFVQIYENSYIEKIKKYNEDLSDLLEINETDFDPPNINSFNNSLSRNLEFSNFYFENSFSSNYNEELIKNKIECSFCKKNISKYYCKTCIQFYCENCFEALTNKNHLHPIESLDNIRTEKELNRTLFFNSIKIIIKKLLLMINYILSNEKKKILDSSNNTIKTNSNSNYILRVFNYPYIASDNDFDAIVNFFKDINFIIKDEFNISDLDISKFQISELNHELINLLKNIFYDSRYFSFIDYIDILDNNFYSDE